MPAGAACTLPPQRLGAACPFSILHRTLPMDINRNAPAVAAAESLIHAPLDLVWSVQTDIAGWSRWNPAVTRAELQGPFAPGTAFRWKAGGAPIVSTIEEIIPKRRIVWTGRSLSIRAVHVWTFEEERGGVLTRTEESLEGPLVRLFVWPMRRMLASSVEQGLRALKAECERRAAERAP